jgi:hypothetical protein
MIGKSEISAGVFEAVDVIAVNVFAATSRTDIRQTGIVLPDTVPPLINSELYQ